MTHDSLPLRLGSLLVISKPRMCSSGRVTTHHLHDHTMNAQHNTSSAVMGSLLLHIDVQYLLCGVLLHKASQQCSHMRLRDSIHQSGRRWSVEAPCSRQCIIHECISLLRFKAFGTSIMQGTADGHPKRLITDKCWVQFQLVEQSLVGSQVGLMPSAAAQATLGPVFFKCRRYDNVPS